MLLFAAAKVNDKRFCNSVINVGDNPALGGDYDLYSSSVVVLSGFAR